MATLLEYVLPSFILTRAVDVSCCHHPDLAGFELLDHQAAPEAIVLRSPAAHRRGYGN